MSAIIYIDGSPCELPDRAWSCPHGGGCQQCTQLNKMIRDGEDRDARNTRRESKR